jgi:isopentenyl-diphosphate delta-isomerase type 1
MELAPIESASIGQRQVVLLDRWGRPAGTVDKSLVHHDATPLHLAFSCHVVRGDQVLLTRRSAHKRTWPGVWSNACCGHPQPGETLRHAVARHLGDELGVAPVRLALAFGDFAYRAVMADGTVEHELCPVVVAEITGTLRPDPDESDDWQWVAWSALVARVATAPDTLSPWSVAQVRHFVAAGASAPDVLVGGDPADGLLDVPPQRAHRPSERRSDEVDPLGAELQRVEDRLAGFLDERRHDVPEASDATLALHSAISSLTAAGGKRLRPAFVLGGHLAGGGTPGDEAALDAAAAVELLHTFALLHDDVMDRSQTRRGRATAQLSLRREHQSSSGDVEWFGISAAILAGDLAFVWADRMFDPAGSGSRRARDLFTTLRAEVIAGQFLDLRAGCSAAAGEGDALRIALLKSARYTVTRPLQIGAALAGADDATIDRLAAYGDALGLAFQLRDDVLSLFGDQRQTGKSCTGDLREGKRTLLVLRALELATATDRITLEAGLGTADLDAAAAQRCREVIADSGALASVEAAIEVHLERAVALAAAFDAPASGVLLHLAERAASRDR